MKSTIWLVILTMLGMLGVAAPARPALAAPARTDIPGVGIEANSVGPLAIRTDGAFIAWTQQFQPNRFVRYANLYTASLADSRPTLLASQLVFGHYIGPLTPGFDLDNGTLVWIDAPNSGATSFPLRARNLRTGESKTVTDGPAAYPAIAGDTVVWWEDLGWGGANSAQPARLKARNISAMSDAVELTQIPPIQDYLIQGVRLSSSWVVWRQGSYSNGTSNPACWDLYALPIAGGTPRKIDTLGCPNSSIADDAGLSGDMLSYTNSAGQLVVANLAIGASSVSGPHDNRGSTMDGRYVFWAKQSDPSLWGYDPATDSAFPIDNQVYRETRPAARNGTLAWFATTNGQDVRIRARPVAELLPSAPRAASDPAVAGRSYFPETGHTLGGAFRDYWRGNGGLPVFGFALTEEFVQKAPDSPQGYTVQYFERQRFEYHPENSGTPYMVLLGRLGAEALAARGRDWQALPKANSSAPHYFPTTGQAIAPEFWEYWRSHGLEFGDARVSEREALALWGYPITPAAEETLPTGETLLVQWFERARFEYHPNNPDPYKVLLGRLAADRVDAFGWR